jgi:Lrp/AsnC family leucine-responsive transcriptional regulator
MLSCGDYDYILKIVVRDMEAYRVLVTKLTTLQHIGTQSTFMISEVKNTTVVEV